MATIAERLTDHPFFAGLPPDSIDLVAGCAKNARFRAGEYLYREGQPADTFFVVRHGRVALEMRTPTGSTVIDTAEEGEVLGWSWLVPPYRWTFDGRAVDDVRAVCFDGACLRGKCTDDPELGYAFLQRVVGVMSARLHSARVRLLDLYGRP
ncbi:MAG: cyclic nucleotide-binding domain-containing protein [Nocardioides sp.]